MRNLQCTSKRHASIERMHNRHLFLANSARFQRVMSHAGMEWERGEIGGIKMLNGGMKWRIWRPCCDKQRKRDEEARKTNKEKGEERTELSLF